MIYINSPFVKAPHCRDNSRMGGEQAFLLKSLMGKSKTKVATESFVVRNAIMKAPYFNKTIQMAIQQEFWYITPDVKLYKLHLWIKNLFENSNLYVQKYSLARNGSISQNILVNNNQKSSKILQWALGLELPFSEKINIK